MVTKSLISVAGLTLRLVVLVVALTAMLREPALLVEVVAVTVADVDLDMVITYNKTSHALSLFTLAPLTCSQAQVNWTWSRCM